MGVGVRVGKGRASVVLAAGPQANSSTSARLHPCRPADLRCTPLHPLHLATPVSSAGVWQHRHIAGPTLPPVAGQLAQLTSGTAVQQQLYQTAVHGRVDGSSSEKVLSRMIVRPEPKQKHPGSLPRTLSSGGGVAAK